MTNDLKTDEIIDFDDELNEKNLNEINEMKMNDIELNSIDVEKNNNEMNNNNNDIDIEKDNIDIEKNNIDIEKNDLKINVKNMQMETNKEKESKSMIRNETCPTNVRIILLKNGKQLKWNDYATLHSKKSLADSEDISLLDLYAWPDTSLQELGYLIANKIPTFIPSPSLKLAFKAIHVDRLVQQELKSHPHPPKASISDLGFLFLNRPSIDSSSILFNSRFSLGDILEVSVLTRTRGEAPVTRSDLRSALKNSSARFAPYTTTRRK